MSTMHVSEIIRGLRIAIDPASPEIAQDAPEPPLTCEDLGLGKNAALSQTWRKRWLKLEEHHPDVRAMCESVESWVKRLMSTGPHVPFRGLRLSDTNGPRMLILCGRNGTGKTTASKRAISFVGRFGITAWDGGLCLHPPSSTVFSWSDLANLGPADRTPETRWVDAIEADAVLIDDIGSEVDPYRSSLPTENLRRLLEDRQNKWTILTTNVPPEYWEERWDLRVKVRLDRGQVVVMRDAQPWMMLT